MHCRNTHNTHPLWVILSALAALATADKRVLQGPGDTADYNAGNYGQRPSQKFFSSTVRAPRILINQWDKSKCEPATHIFTGIDLDGQRRSPLILSADDLSMVYADPSWRGGTDTRPQTYNGSTYLTFFSGVDHTSWGAGSSIMLDDTYKLYTELHPEGLENNSDPHEFQITDDDTAIFTNYHQVPGNCEAMGGPGGMDCKIWESNFQELDIATRKPLFTWHASEHVLVHESYLKFMNSTQIDEPPGSSHKPKVKGYDFMHINAVSKTRDGKNYLVNGRHLYGVMLINGTSGDRIWQLGGRANMFRDLSNGSATNFRAQHHARFSNPDETEISLFDNHSFGQDLDATPGCANSCTRVMRIRLDYEAMTAELVSEWWHPVSVQARAQGGQHVLPGGGAMVAWGVVPALTEYTKDGEVCMDVQVGPWSTSQTGESNVYRAYKFNYTATPHWDPEIAVVEDKVYVSWNGATEVKSWVLYGGETESTMQELTSSPRKGFETMIQLPDPNASLPLFVRASAVDKDNNTLRSTRLITTLPIIRRRRREQRLQELEEKTEEEEDDADGHVLDLELD